MSHICSVKFNSAEFVRSDTEDLLLIQMSNSIVFCMHFSLLSTVACILIKIIVVANNATYRLQES